MTVAPAAASPADRAARAEAALTAIRRQAWEGESRAALVGRRDLLLMFAAIRAQADRALADLPAA